MYHFYGCNRVVHTVLRSRDLTVLACSGNVANSFALPCPLLLLLAGSLWACAQVMCCNVRAVGYSSTYSFTASNFQHPSSRKQEGGSYGMLSKANSPGWYVEINYQWSSSCCPCTWWLSGAKVSATVLALLALLTS
jgi:hypothetical protein